MEDIAPEPIQPQEQPEQFDRRKAILRSIALVTLGVVLLTAVIAGLIKTNKSDTTPKQSTEQTPKPAIATPSVGQPTDLNLPNGFSAKIFASDLPKARDLAFSPGGTLLVSQLEVNRIVALPDRNKDGVADSTKEVATGNTPHGIAFHGEYLFVAELEKVIRYKWDESTLTATPDKELFSYPSSGHSSRTLAVYPDGRLYVSIGSSCNVCVEDSSFLAAVVESNINGDNPHVFASGSRNASFLAINPKSQELWATENSRDLLGDDIPPDEINILNSGKHYGWPYCYADQVRDTTFNITTSFNCSTTQIPAYKVQAHSAPLGLAFIDSTQFPTDWQGDLLVAFHGSWNRSVKTGYKVVKLNVNGDTITDQEDFVTLNDGDIGRPVDMVFDKLGNLYLSDDKTGAIYIIQHP